MPIIDCRGLACPQPVVTTKQALDQLNEGEMTVIVDDVSSCQNVERFAESQGCLVKIEQEGKDFYLHIQKPACVQSERVVRPAEKIKNVVVYINSHLLGGGDEVLGSFLMKSFLKTLLEVETKPHRLILVNSGVQLAAEDSKALDSLQVLSEKNVEIVYCGTCVDFYNLKGKMKIGVVSNMYDIVQSMIEADCVIRP